MSPDHDYRGALGLCAVAATCVTVWMLGTMWQEARSATGAPGSIASPVPALWYVQSGLIVLLFGTCPRRTLILSAVVPAAFLPLWVLSFLIGQLHLPALLGMQVALLAVGLVLAACATLFCRIPSNPVRRGAAAGLQVLCIWALFGLSSALLNWVV